MLDNLGTKSGQGVDPIDCGSSYCYNYKKFYTCKKILIDGFSSFTSFLVKTKRERLGNDFQNFHSYVKVFIVNQFSNHLIIKGCMCLCQSVCMSASQSQNGLQFYSQSHLSCEHNHSKGNLSCDPIQHKSWQLRLPLLSLPCVAQEYRLGHRESRTDRFCWGGANALKEVRPQRRPNYN